MLTAIAMMIQGYSAVQMYQAQARLLIENERSTTLPGLTSAPDAFYEDPEPYYETQYKILRGRDLARRVVKRVKLETIPEFNGTAPRPASPATYISDIKQRVLGVFRTPAAVEAPKVDETPDESALVSDFIGRVSVQPVRGSRLVDVLFDSATGAFAAEAVNALAEEYVEREPRPQAAEHPEHAGVARQGAAEPAAESPGQRARARRIPRQAERPVARRQTEHRAFPAERLERRRHQGENPTRIQKEALFNQVKTLPAGAAPDTLPIIAQNSAIQNLKSKLTDLQREKAKLSQQVRRQHPALQNVMASLQDAQRPARSGDIQSAHQRPERIRIGPARRADVLAVARRGKADAADLNRKSINYSVMEREAKSNRADLRSAAPA